MRYFVTAVFLLCALAPAAPPAARGPASRKSPPDWFWGCWVVKKDLDVKDISGLAQKQADALVGTGLVFTPSYARWGETVVKPAKYSVRVESNRRFFQEGTYNKLHEIGVRGIYVTKVTLDLPEGLSDLDFPGTYSYLRKKDIVIAVEGDYFVAEKAKPNDRACKPTPYNIRLPWQR